MNDRLSPDSALAKAVECLSRANEISASYTSGDHQLRRGELSLGLAHAYMRYVELTTIKRET